MRHGETFHDSCGGLRMVTCLFQIAKRLGHCLKSFIVDLLQFCQMDGDASPICIVILIS
jgi:hypothetical protein